MTETVKTRHPTVDREQIAERHLRWMNALVVNEGDPALDWRARLGDLYDFDGPDVVLYDDFDPQHRVARSAADYAAIWEPAFAGVLSSRHAASDGPHVLMGDRFLAASWLQFDARARLIDGRTIEFRSTSSMVFRRADAGWRIVREHNSTVLLPTGALDSVFGPS